MTLGQRLYEMRRSRGMSQEQTAELLGVTRQTISKWETDQTTPDFDKILPLCDLYGISTDELLRGEANQKNDERSDKNIFSDDCIIKSEAENTDNMMNDDYNKRKIKSSIIMSVAIGLYIMSVIPFFIFESSKLMLSLFFAIIAAATIMVVFASLSKPKNKLYQQSKENKLYKQITSILASVVLVIYLLISFFTGMWHITWLLWVIYGIICEIIKLFFLLKGCEINESE